MNCQLIGAAQVDGVWQSLSDGFRRSNQRSGGDLTVGDLWQACRSGAAFLIVAHDETGFFGASVWKPDRWDSGTKLRCLGLYGRQMRLWIEPMHEMARNIARDCGANGLIADGRTGWKIIFPKARILRIVYEEPV